VTSHGSRSSTNRDRCRRRERQRCHLRDCGVGTGIQACVANPPPNPNCSTYDTLCEIYYCDQPVISALPACLASASTETILHSFNSSDGANPDASLIPDATGALYGTASAGGASGDGTVFKLTLPGTFTGVPGQSNCTGQSISFMAKKYGGIAHAADSLGYSSVAALQNAVAAYCGG
jgi:uncharacterized repeat protein (TIGR03803 family)